MCWSKPRSSPPEYHSCIAVGLPSCPSRVYSHSPQGEHSKMWFLSLTYCDWRSLIASHLAESEIHKILIITLKLPMTRALATALTSPWSLSPFSAPENLPPVSQTCQAHSCLRDFALAISSIWNVFSLDICRAYSLTLLRFLLKCHLIAINFHLRSLEDANFFPWHHTPNFSNTILLIFHLLYHLLIVLLVYCLSPHLSHNAY